MIQKEGHGWRDYSERIRDLADAVAFEKGTPETAAVSEIIIRPSKQAD